MIKVLDVISGTKVPTYINIDNITHISQVSSEAPERGTYIWLLGYENQAKLQVNLTVDQIYKEIAQARIQRKEI